MNRIRMQSHVCTMKMLLACSMHGKRPTYIHASYMKHASKELWHAADISHACSRHFSCMQQTFFSRAFYAKL